jgi:uncharacterized protein YbaP (TraB family)
MKRFNIATASATAVLALFMAAGVTAAPIVAAAASPAAQPTYDPTRPAAREAAPVAVPVTPATAAVSAVDASRTNGAKSFLWEVKSKTNTIYLFGTIHVGKRAFYPLAPQVEEAFKQSQRLVVEADISNNEGMADIATLINYKAPDSLDKHITPALFERLKIQLVRLHLPIEAVKPMKPYLIGGFLSIAEFSKLGYDMNLGVDGYLIAKAKDAGMPILELESQSGQLKMLDGLSPTLQEAFLENAIGTLESGKASDQVTGMVNAWQSGDVDLMREVSKGVNKNMRMTDQLDEVLLHSRHGGMLKKMENYLAGGVTHFVAVGSLHLVGPRGLVEMLKARGFEVKQQ